MMVALIDNGSLEPAAHDNLVAAAEALSLLTGCRVHAVSWKHSDRIPPAGRPRAWTLAPFVRAMAAEGDREFLLVPFFISAQGAIGTALRRDAQRLESEIPGVRISFSGGLADREALASIVAARVREIMTARNLVRPAVVVVDHGGPSPASARVRDRVVNGVHALLRDEVASVAAASMEGEAFPHNRPLLADLLAAMDLPDRDVVIAPLFLSPGRHAGPQGDLARIATRSGAPRCHFTGLVGSHPLALDALAAALREALAPLHAQTLFA